MIRQENDQRPHPHDHHPPPFVGHGPPEKVVLNGITGEVEAYHPSAAVARALQEAGGETGGNWVFFAAMFRMHKEELKAQVSDAQRLRLLGYSLLFRASLTSPGGGANPLSWGGNGDPGPDMSLERIASADEARRRATATLGPAIEGPEPRKALEEHLRLIISALLHGHGWVPYYAHWDNSDDTTIEGVFGINEEHGEVRVLSMWQPA